MGRNMTIVEYESDVVNKSTGKRSFEKRLYVTSLPTHTPRLGDIVRKHWSIESMHWGLDVNLLQDKIKRRTSKAARNLDTIHRIIYSVFSVWRRLRKKKTDRRKWMAEIMRHISASFLFQWCSCASVWTSRWKEEDLCSYLFSRFWLQALCTNRQAGLWNQLHHLVLANRIYLGLPLRLARAGVSFTKIGIIIKYESLLYVFYLK